MRHFKLPRLANSLLLTGSKFTRASARMGYRERVYRPENNYVDVPLVRRFQHRSERQGDLYAAERNPSRI